MEPSLSRKNGLTVLVTPVLQPVSPMECSLINWHSPPHARTHTKRHSTSLLDKYNKEDIANFLLKERERERERGVVVVRDTTIVGWKQYFRFEGSQALPASPSDKGEA
jgi:hypothetical protein